jgi:ferric-dicitrate binding protein FerR (iron transport regulator)
MIENEIRKLIRCFLEGNLSAEKEQFLLSWIKDSETNKNLFLSEQEKLHNEFITSNDHHLEMRWQSLLTRIQTTGSQPKRKLMLQRIASIAAAFILGVVLTFSLTEKVNTNTNFVTRNITTPFGAKTSFELPDGSFVWLNSGSVLSYPSGFGENRSVKLAGEAYFKVKKGERPFIVSTEFGDVEVKGTSFNVKAFKNEIFETTLVTGVVNVKEKNTKKEVTLAPGQQVDIFDSQIRVKNVDTELYTSWKDGKLIFREEYLPTAVKRLERWYNVTIELDNDPRLSKIWYSGTLEMESFSEVLELLKVTAPITYNYNEKTRTIQLFYE